MPKITYHIHWSCFFDLINGTVYYQFLTLKALIIAIADNISEFLFIFVGEGGERGRGIFQRKIGLAFHVNCLPENTKSYFLRKIVKKLE